MFFSKSQPSPLPYRTNGIYGHLPKFYTCRGPLEDFGGEFEPCPRPTRHLSSVGYLGIQTPWGHGKFWYMGNPYRHKIFEWWSKR